MELAIQEEMIEKLKAFESRLAKLEHQTSLQLSEPSKGFSEYERFDSFEALKHELDELKNG